MTRQKIVREDVAHVWAHRLQEEARNKGGNLYFYGDTIYSYGSHFPIAKHVEHKGQRCILFTTRTYSNTTRGHCYEVERAIPPGVPVFHVQHPTNVVRADMADEYAERIEFKLKEAAKARQRQPYLMQEAQRLVEEAREFCKFFGIRRKFKDVGSADEIKEQIAAAEKAKAAKRAKQIREQQKKDAERLEKWLAGEYVPGSFYSLGTDYMRIEPAIEGAEACVRTTKNAIVPLRHVKRIAKLVLRHVKSGTHWQTNGETIRVGEYKLSEILPDGTVIVGCHRFSKEEITRFAKLIGVE